VAVRALVRKNAVAMSAAATIGNRRERFVWMKAVFISTDHILPAEASAKQTICGAYLPLNGCKPERNVLLRSRNSHIRCNRIDDLSNRSRDDFDRCEGYLLNLL
jgi:aconitase A